MTEVPLVSNTIYKVVLIGIDPDSLETRDDKGNSTAPYEIVVEIPQGEGMVSETVTLRGTLEDVSGALALDDRGPEMNTQAVRLPDGRAQISITATDPSGVANIHYSLDNSITMCGYTGPFTVDPAEVTNLVMLADDQAGNRSFIQTTITELLAGPVTNW